MTNEITETAATVVDQMLARFGTEKTGEILRVISKPTAPGSEARTLQDNAIRALMRT